MNFEADVSRLLEIVTHALYSNRDVFLRELISNAADACDRLRYEAIQKPDLAKDHDGFKIKITTDAKARLLTVQDTGIGMSKDELAENLGTIAKSGTRTLMEQLKQKGAGQGMSLIGQFGVGFYAAFMVATKVEVISRYAGSTEVWHWESDGAAGYTLREATAEEAGQLLTTSGTTIVLHIKDDCSEFLFEEKIKMVVGLYSNHISLPIYIGEDSEPANSASALWMKPKSEISEDEYQEFFAMCAGSYELDKPLVTAHWRAEGKIEYTALLFVPSLRPWDLYDPTRRHAIRLYVRRVFITEGCEGLMYPWLRFVRGVIDSEDLPLNISREMLQHNQVVQRIRSSVAKHILGDIDKLSRTDITAFDAFWLQFGSVVKEGLYDAPDHREDIFKVARFFTTHHADNKLTSLDDYLARMPEGQNEIYYISGESVDNLRHSPQIEGLKSRGIEVLLFKDTIDDFWLPVVMDYKGKKFTSATQGTIDFSKFSSEKKEADANGKIEEPPQPEARQDLVAYLKKQLEEWVSDVRISQRLTESPVCLVASEKDADLNVSRVLKIHQNYKVPSKPILEINPRHKLIARLDAIAQTDSSDQNLKDAAELLLDQARIIQGEPVSDPASFARRMADFMARGLAA